MKPTHTVLDPRAQIIQQNYSWEGDQWNGQASTFDTFERALRNKACATTIDYLLRLGYMTKSCTKLDTHLVQTVKMKLATLEFKFDKTIVL